MFEQMVLFSVDILFVTLNHWVQCPRVGLRLGVKILDILDIFFFFLLLFFLYGIIQFEQHVLFRVFLSVTSDLNLNLNLNSLLVKRQIDNPSPGAVTGGI